MIQTVNHPDQPVPAVSPRRSLWRRWGFWLTFALLGALTVPLADMAYRHYRVGVDLQNAVAELDCNEPGWRLHDLEAARTVLSNRDNAAVCVEQADSLLPKKPEADYNDRVLPCLSRLNALEPNQRPSPADLDILQEDLKNRQAALDKARELVDQPNGRYAIHYKRPVFATLLPQCAKANNITSLLCNDAVARAQHDDAKEALRSCRAALNAGRSLGDEPFTVSQFVRMGCIHNVCSTIERVLAQTEPDKNDLMELHKVLEEEKRYPRLLVMVRGERALVHDMLDAVECGDVSLDDFLNATGLSNGGQNTTMTSVDAVRATHPGVVKAMTEATEIARLPPCQRTAQIDAFEVRLRTTSAANLLNPIFFNLRGLDDTTRAIDARLRCLIAVVALERYRLLHGGWPESLLNLTPELLAEVPSDPADGEALGYRRYPDRVVVYSRMQTPQGFFARRAFDPDAPFFERGVGVAAHLFDVGQRRRPSK